MKPVVLAIFAHPDDESFGPGGTLALFAQTHEVYVLYISKGQAGEVEGLVIPEEKAAIRQKEAKKACRILGVKKTYFLNYHDGLLCNNHYHKMARSIEAKVHSLQPEILITFEPRGFTGHLDHVLVSHVTTFVYQKSQQIKKLLYFCINEKQRSVIPSYYIYFPPGYKKREIGETIDVSSVWEKKMQAINAHFSQKNDRIFYQSFLNASEKQEHFLVEEKGGETDGEKSKDY